MGIMITVAFVIMVIGYLIGKGDVAAKCSPDLLAPEPIKKTGDRLNDTNTRPLSSDILRLYDCDDEPTPHLCRSYWRNHRFSHHSVMHHDLLDPTNLLSPFNPVIVQSGFHDDMFTHRLSDDGIFNSSINNDSFSSFDSHSPFD